MILPDDTRLIAEHVEWGIRDRRTGAVLPCGDAHEARIIATVIPSAEIVVRHVFDFGIAAHLLSDQERRILAVLLRRDPRDL